MTIKIRNWKTGELLLESRESTYKSLNLRGRSLYYADLRYKNLSNADLRGVDLRKSKLDHSKLYVTNLEGADLRGATLKSTKLIKTNLSRAILVNNVFEQIQTFGTKFYMTTMGENKFINCFSLHYGLRIDTIRHIQPSSIDYETISACFSSLPKSFFEGIGFTKEKIMILNEAFNSKEVNKSCFIATSGIDIDFSKKIYKDLELASIKCWLYIYDMKGGLEWRKQISKAIKKHKKLILVCSRHSIYNKNVVKEIFETIDQERLTGRRKLFPVRLDDHILSEDMDEEAREKVRSGEWRENWVYYVKKYHILDFAEWKNEKIYEKLIKKLIEDVRDC